MRAGTATIDALLQDLRYAWRGILANPGFSAAVVITLALGIGANTAMFGIVDRLLFRPPAYLRRPGEVNRVYLSWTGSDGDRTDRAIEYTRYADLTRWTTSFDQAAVAAYRPVAVGIGEDAREMTVAGVSASFFDLFDAVPAAGRFFGPAEDHTPVGEPVAVLAYDFWQSHDGGRDVIGTKLHVGPGVFTIIGVAPPGFVGITDDRPPAVFIPVTAMAASNPKYYLNYQWGWLELFVRRKAGVTATAANADLTSAYRRSWEAERALGPVPDIDKARPHATAGSVHLSRGPEASPDSRIVTWVMGVAVIVLLVACANVINLMLARAVARRREIALRVALGVSRRRLVQQLATERLLLAGLGGCAGLLLAHWGGRLLTALFAREGEPAAGITDVRTLLFVGGLTLTVALLTGLAPILHALRADINGALKAGAREGAYRRSRVGTGLLLFQGALSVVLLVGAGLFVRSLSNVRSMRLGYDVDPLVYVEANMRGLRPPVEQARALSARLLELAQATPGVVSATIVVSVPFWSSEGRGVPYVPGHDSLQKLGSFSVQAGSPSYFETVGTRILSGRGFLATDREDGPHVAVISQTMAQAIWPGENALGKQFRIGDDTMPFITVVGVAENIRGRRITKADELWYYLPIAQFAGAYPTFFIRVSGRAEDAVASLRRRLQSAMPGAAYVNVMPLRALVSPQQRGWQFGATMFVAFGGLALVLAAVGLYSVIAYAVAQRTRELGVRLALGARATDVTRMIVRDGVSFAVAGIVIGSTIALGSGRWIEPMLFEESARDPLVYLAVGAALMVVAVAATIRPALRAMRVDPIQVLRGE